MHELQGGAGVASRGAGQGLCSAGMASRNTEQNLHSAGRGCARGLREAQEDVVQVEHEELVYRGGKRRQGKGEVGLGWGVLWRWGWPAGAGRQGGDEGGSVH